jgi:hypothetical protein
MWQFLNANAGAVQAISAVVVVLLTLALTAATFKYVRLTKTIAQASTTQAEAVHKPVLTLKRSDETTPPDVAVVTERVREAMDGRLGVNIGPTLEITNIGTGPALQVRWTLHRFAQTGGFIPYVGVGESISLQTASKVKMGAVPTTYELECNYESISGQKYVSRTRVENSTKVVSFDVREGRI